MYHLAAAICLLNYHFQKKIVFHKMCLSCFTYSQEKRTIWNLLILCMLDCGFVTDHWPQVFMFQK